MPSVFLILLLCLCLLACNARPLGITQKETIRKVHLLNKDLEKGKLQHTSSSSRPSPSIYMEQQTLENFMVGHLRKPNNNNWGGVNSMKRKDLKTVWMNTGRLSSVTKLVGQEISDSHWQEPKIEGWKRQARSMLTSTHQNSEEAVDSEENDAAEDIVVMDYAQPHRKPPIHNREP